ncbi:MAG TPA: hypothetical protein VFV78_10190 [Vicinamibacterales bacterium]|nr:hypothetical protein [Vicinamibacterales bacterium]
MQNGSLAGRLAAVLVSCAIAGGACIFHHASSHATSRANRRDALHRAQVWSPTDIAGKDLVAGPQGPGAFKPGETITCDYQEQEVNGRSPKFMCAMAGAGNDGKDVIKVKYGRDNAEVYGEMLGTRLLWALGFGADRMYAVRVICRGCPSTIEGGTLLPSGDRLFDPATVERKAAGREIESYSGQGWAWWELDEVDPAAGGAPLAHRDGLKLLAVMIQHSDSKPEQQRLVCLDDAPNTEPVDAPCAHPFMLIQDIGLIFGRTDLFFHKTNYVNVDRWAGTTVWAPVPGCVGNLYRPFLGTLERPAISEAGRSFLAGLLDQLRDAQIRDLFTAARLDLRSRDPKRDRGLGGADVAPGDPRVIDDWVAAFKHKRQEIASRQCPVSTLK